MGKKNRPKGAHRDGDSFKLKTIERKETVIKRAEDMADIEIMRKREHIDEMPTRGFETSAMVGLFASLGAMNMVEPDLMNRLKSVKNGLRDYRGAKSALWRSCQRLLATMPDDKVASLLRMKDYLNFKTYLDRRVVDSEDGLTVLKMDDLEVLISASHEYCKMCDRNCDTCRLGKTLDRCQPETRERHRSWSMMDIGDFNPGHG